MILYARNLSPFGRRVAVWLGLHGIPFRQEALAPMEHFDELRRKNPIGRAPALELDDGRVLVDSTLICDHLETIAPPEKRLIPTEPAARLEVTQAMAHAHGVAEKGVAFAYEALRRPQEFQWPAWQERLTVQLQGALAAVEERTPAAGFHGGDKPNGADIVAAIAHDFIALARPDLLGEATPKLAALASRAGELDAFKDTTPQMA